MAKVWLFQDYRRKEQLGERKCPWSVGFMVEGKRRSKKIGTRTQAERFAEDLGHKLATGTFEQESRERWDDFRREYTEKVLSQSSPANRESCDIALDHFKRICQPVFCRSITTAMIDGYAAKRCTERGKKRKSKVSRATINKELRHIRAAVLVAVEYEYLREAPKVRMLREPSKEKSYVTAADFAKIYHACDVARMPKEAPSPENWWQALTVFGYMTGWRISEILSLRWEDVDLEACTALTRHADNKGGRDERVPLHPLVIEHLERIRSFGTRVFPWSHHQTTIWCEFQRIQEHAGIHLECRERHEHTDRCRVYGFHDLRRAFATENEGLSGNELQKLMRHKSYSTTQRYIQMRDRLAPTVSKLHVPDLKKTGTEN